MRDDVLYKIKDDPRKTKVGAFIERFSIDELPQFSNALFGSMSLVGPRPPGTRGGKYKEYHRRLLTIKPGYREWRRCLVGRIFSFRRRGTSDIFYIENWSLWLDISILSRKLLRVLFATAKKRCEYLGIFPKFLFVAFLVRIATQSVARQALRSVRQAKENFFEKLY